MLNKIKQISLALACMILLIHAIVPHHHHTDRLVCISLLNHDDCDNHSSCCDSGKQEENHHDFGGGHCVIDDYFTPKDNSNINISTDLEHSFHFYNFIFNLFTSDFILKDKGDVFRRNNLTFTYKDPLAISNIGLRAPPVVIYS